MELIRDGRLTEAIVYTQEHLHHSARAHIADPSCISNGKHERISNEEEDSNNMDIDVNDGDAEAAEKLKSIPSAETILAKAEGFHLLDVMGLLAYTNPMESPLRFLLLPKRREATAALVNALCILHLLRNALRSVNGDEHSDVDERMKQKKELTIAEEIISLMPVLQRGVRQMNAMHKVKIDHFNYRGTAVPLPGIDQ